MGRATKHHDLKHAAQKVWGKALKLLGNDVQTAHGLHTALDGIIGATAIRQFVELAGTPLPFDPGAVDELFSPAQRRDQGMYFTPAELAVDMATWLDAGSGWVVDPAAGAGALLVAAAQCGHDVWGIEADLVAAVAAAIMLRPYEVRSHMVWGDGLDPSHWPTAVKAVLANPPYVGEKGRKTFFRELRTRFSDLEPAFAPRSDLAYAFWLRSLLSGAQQTVFLVSEYWMWADSAAGLRREMAERLPVKHLIRLGGGRFESAPGHHSMLVVNERHGGAAVFCEAQANFDRETIAKQPSVDWTVDERGAEVRGTVVSGHPLVDLLVDHQGFVSGLDRGITGGFLTSGPVLGLHTRPVLRASACVRNRIFLKLPDSPHVVWVDGPLEHAHEHALEAWFGPAGRERLEQRREVQNGRMAWYRLHWPRRRADMTGPKLVVPRRAPAPAFCLDVSGAAVSSDCTYLVAPTEVAEPVSYLIAMMLLLNSSEVEAQLQASGKRKGQMFEFYATPLQRLHVGQRPETLQSEVEQVIQRLMLIDSDFMDIK